MQQLLFNSAWLQGLISEFLFLDEIIDLSTASKMTRSFHNVKIGLCGKLFEVLQRGVMKIRRTLQADSSPEFYLSELSRNRFSNELEPVVHLVASMIIHKHPETGKGYHHISEACILKRPLLLYIFMKHSIEEVVSLEEYNPMFFVINMEGSETQELLQMAIRCIEVLSAYPNIIARTHDETGETVIEALISTGDAYGQLQILRALSRIGLHCQSMTQLAIGSGCSNEVVQYLRSVDE